MLQRQFIALGLLVGLSEGKLYVVVQWVALRQTVAVVLGLLHAGDGRDEVALTQMHDALLQQRRHPVPVVAYAVEIVLTELQ